MWISKKKYELLVRKEEELYKTQKRLCDLRISHDRLKYNVEVFCKDLYRITEVSVSTGT